MVTEIEGVESTGCVYMPRCPSSTTSEEQSTRVIGVQLALVQISEERFQSQRWLKTDEIIRGGLQNSPGI